MELKNFLIVSIGSDEANTEGLTEDLKKISETNVRIAKYDTTVLYTIRTALFLKELKNYLSMSDRYFIIIDTNQEDCFEYELPKLFSEFLLSEGDDELNGAITRLKELYNLDDVSYESVDDDLNVHISGSTPKEYISKLDDDERNSLKESLLNKMPNLSEWEKLVIKELYK